MSRECPSKGKSKVKGKEGGKSVGKGVFGGGKAKGGTKGYVGTGWGKQGGKGGPGGKGKGEGKSGGKGWFGKGFRGGYQGTCYQCGQVGHKAVECGVHMVSEAGDGSEGGGTGAQELPMGGVWTVAAVEAVDVSGGCWRMEDRGAEGRETLDPGGGVEVETGWSGE